MADLTIKRDRRDRRRAKRRPVHGRSLEHVMNAIRKRGATEHERREMALRDRGRTA